MKITDTHNAAADHFDYLEYGTDDDTAHLVLLEDERSHEPQRTSWQAAAGTALRSA